VEEAGCLMITDQRLYFQPLHSASSEPMSRLAFSEVRRVCKRRYAMRQVGIELFLKPQPASASSSTFRDQRCVRKFFGSCIHLAVSITVLFLDLLIFTSASFQFLSSRYPSVFFAFADRDTRDRVYQLLLSATECAANHQATLTLDELTDAWVGGRMSNFDYIMALNFHAGRCARCLQLAGKQFMPSQQTLAVFPRSSLVISFECLSDLSMTFVNILYSHG
jgi:hypothetical protein